MAVAPTAAMRHFLLVAALIPAAACGGASSPSSPSSARPVVAGRTVTALGDAGAQATVIIGSRSTETDASGAFSVEVDQEGYQEASIRARGFVDRRTFAASGAGEQRLSLIPQDFDLAAFNEMARTSNGRLQRWTHRPRLVVVTAVMLYGGGLEAAHMATSERLSDAEADAMVEDFSGALALLTGNAWTSFEAVERDTPAAGQSVVVLRDGWIVAGRYRGVADHSGIIGVGRWQVQTDGSIGAGAVFLDAGFDKNDSRRRLVRIHELGHGLGYTHVTSRTSIMNPVIGPDPTTFDAQAAAIAFQRYPGNLAPDVDPVRPIGPRALLSEGGGQWAPPVICGPPR